MSMDTSRTYNVIPPERGGGPIKAWTQGVPVEEAAERQLRNVAKLPFVFKHVAAMPDVHYGIGSTVGSVIPTLHAVIPAAVGVDIGCGMMATRTTLHATHLPDNLHGLRDAIEKAVPHGRTNNGRPGDVGAWDDPPEQTTATVLPRAGRRARRLPASARDKRRSERVIGISSGDRMSPSISRVGAL